MITLVEAYEALLDMAETGATQEELKGKINHPVSAEYAEQLMSKLGLKIEHVDEFVDKVLPQIIDQVSEILAVQIEGGRPVNMDYLVNSMAGMGLLTGLQVGALYTYNHQEERDA
jgi:hypothetical protein